MSGISFHPSGFPVVLRGRTLATVATDRAHTEQGRQSVIATVRRFLPGAVLLILVAPMVAGADPPRVPERAGSRGDSAFARGNYGTGVQARRALHEATLASRRQALSSGRPELALQYGGFSDPDLRAEDLDLIRRSAEALISRGSTERVYHFLEGFKPPEADAWAVRRELWRALAAAYRPGEEAGLKPREYARAVERAESLAVFAPENRAVGESLDHLRARAAAFHAARAVELSAYPAASFFHRRVAAGYGAAEDRAGLQADRAVLRLTRPAYILRYPEPVEEPCLGLTRRLEAILGRGDGLPVSVTMSMDRCGPGRHAWENAAGESIRVVRTSPDRTTPGTTHRGRGGTVIPTPKSVLPGRRTVEWMHPMEERDTYLVHGTATVACEGGEETVLLDVHPKPGPGDSQEDHVRAAAHETADAIQGAWRRIAESRADRFLRQAAEGRKAGRDDVAEDAYATAILLLRAVPEPAALHYGDRYGLGAADLTRCLPPDPLP